uniref:Variant surface glycoprotein 1125.5045 n=1 Tax=Trypanosoma brucei TaxID=5691 RepID=A0A1J0RBY1_9TRYP|nr:variant surface glycoprotein 1125.5045 [Trypanosoma brucei]
MANKSVPTLEITKGLYNRHMNRTKWSAAQLLLSVALINVITKKVEAGPGNAMKKEAWGILCNIADDLDKAPSNVASVFLSSLPNTKQLTKLQAQLSLYRATQIGSTASEKETIFGAFLGRKLSDSKPPDNSVLQALAAANRLGFFHGHLAEWLSAAASTSTSGTTGCLGVTSDGDAIKLAALKGAPHSCKIEPPSVTNKFTSLAKFKSAGIDTGAAKSNIAASHTNGNGGCAFTVHANNCLAGGKDTTHKIPFAAGYFYVDNNEIKTEDRTALVPGTNDAHVKAWEAANQYSSAAPQPNYTKITDLKQDSDFRAAPTAVIYGDKDASQLDNKLKDLFGDSVDSFEEKLWKHVRETKIDAAKFGEKDATTIQGLEDPIKLTKAIYYYANQAAEKIKTLE